MQRHRRHTLQDLQLSTVVSRPEHSTSTYLLIAGSKGDPEKLTWVQGGPPETPPLMEEEGIEFSSGLPLSVVNQLRGSQVWLKEHTGPQVIQSPPGPQHLQKGAPHLDGLHNYTDGATQTPDRESDCAAQVPPG